MGEGVGERSHRALVHDSQGRRDIFFAWITIQRDADHITEYIIFSHTFCRRMMASSSDGGNLF